MIVEFSIFVVFSITLAWYVSLLLSKKISKEPPGPTPLPILGDLLTITKASVIPHDALGILAKKYGEIFKLQMGTVPTVVLASSEAVKTVFTKEDGCGRDCRGIFHDRSLKQNLGIGFSNGHLFKTTRAWAMRTLKECGFGRNNTMEATINEEARYFTKKLDACMKNDGGILDTNLQFSIHTLNITWIMFTGQRSDEDNKKITSLLKASDDFIRAGVFGTGVLVAYPFLRYIFPGITGYNIQMKCTKEIHDLAVQVLYEHKGLGSYKDEAHNFVESYLQKMETADSTDSVFTVDNFKVIFADLFQGSIETTAAFLETLLLHLALNPKIQRKVQEEIDEIIPEGTDCTMEHCKRMPYTQAVIWECHRHAKTLPQFIPHKALNDFYYKDYLIKKDTVIIPATVAVNNDPAVFSNPNEFYPEHFIDNKGNLINTDKIFPFGIGKRSCPGEPVAPVIIFIFIATMLQSYTFTTVPNEPLPTTEMQLGFTMRPFPYRVLVQARSKK